MRKKVFLTMAIAVIGLMFGVTNVYAETCTFSDANSRINKIYKVTLNSRGNVTKITYEERDDIGGTGTTVGPNDVTSTMSVDFSTCPTAIKVSGSVLKADSSGNFKNVASLPGSSNSSSNGNGPTWLNGDKVSCGNIGQIPAKAPELVHMFILIAQIAVPVILVILGMIDLGKGVMSQKEDEIKKGQKTFINRLILGAIIFFVVALVKLLVGIVVDNTGNRGNIIACIDCFVNNDCG